MNTAISLTSTSHQFDGVNALQNISLTIEPGEIVALLGASGAGKSTLLSLLDGQLGKAQGPVTVLGNDLSKETAQSRSNRADVGFIFQEFALIDRLSVYQNVMNGRLGRMRAWPSLWGRFDARDHMIVSSALRDTGLEDFARRRADQLSGGQRQRVAIARCLAQEPQLILADEPVSNLDPAHAEKILGLITGEARKRGISVVFSSHQPELSQRFADRVIGLRHGETQFDKSAAQITQDDITQLYYGNLPGAGLRVVS